jgi:hypothetical protein
LLEENANEKKNGEKDMEGEKINKYGLKIPCYLGTFIITDLVKLNIVKNDVSLIIIHEQHAIAVYITEQTIDLFDPLGPGNKKVYSPVFKFLKEHLPCKKLNICAKIQADKSNLCAYFALVFLKLRCKGYSFCEVINLFSGDTKKNDEKIISYFDCLFKNCK